MIKINDIMIEVIEDSSYQFVHGYIDKPLKIFGQMRFNDGDERLGLTFPKGVRIESILDGLNGYLGWLSDCKAELIAFYKSEFESDIDTYFEGKMTADWFETLELYSGTVSYSKDGKFGADFSTGDNMDLDHLLMIEIDGKEIIDMYHEG